MAVIKVISTSNNNKGIIDIFISCVRIASKIWVIKA